MISVTIMKKKIKRRGWEYLKTWVGIFRVGIFWVGIFRGELTRVEFDGWEFSGGGILRVEVFLIPSIVNVFSNKSFASSFFKVSFKLFTKRMT